MATAPWLITSFPAQAATRAPVVNYLSRHAATTHGNVQVVIKGRRFVRVRSVRFGSVRAHFRVVSATRLQATAPAHAAGTVHVVVTTSAGTSKRVRADLFTYRRAPAPTPPNALTDLAAWSSYALPLPGDADAKQSASLTQVSCASKNLCVAIGGYRVGGVNRTLIATYAGGKWSTFDPEPADAQGIDLASVSCAATTCAVAGSLLTGGHWEGLFDVLDNHVWTLSIAPHPAEEPSTPTQWTGVESISCSTVDSCVAVGDYSVGTTTAAGATWTLTGTTWTAATLPAPADADSTATHGYVEPGHVGCNAAGQCVLGGNYVANGSNAGLLGHFDGHTWTTARVVEPDSGSEVHVNDASCASDGTCVVAGQFYDSSNHEQGLLERWTGAWNATRAPLPADAGGNPSTVLESAVCTSSAFCFAAGSYLDAGGHHRGLIEHTGTSGWAGTTPAAPAGAGTGANAFAELHGTSCLAKSCVAVGDYADNVGGLRPWLTAYPTGASSSPKLPAGSTNDSSSLLSVSCSSDGFCMAVGYYQGATSPSLALTVHP